MSNSKLQTVQGYIVALPSVKPSEEIAKVAVITDDGQEWRVLHKGVGADLVKHVSSSVEIQGVPLEGTDEPCICVRIYKLNEDWADD